MRRFASALFSASLLAAAPAAADSPPPAPQAGTAAPTPDEDDDSNIPAATTPAAAGARSPVYQGVSLGAERLPPKARKNSDTKGAPRVTWIGYQAREGVPTVFVQLSRPVVWSVAEAEGRLTYTLVGAKVPLANNRRPLRLQEFGTPLQEVEARSKGRDVDVVVRLGKGKVSHREHIEDGPSGYKFLVIELPAAQ